MIKQKILVLALTATLMTTLVPADIASASLFPVKTETEEMSDPNQTEAEHYLNIGSVSKIYTVTAVMQLMNQGKVDIDAPVTEYIPEFELADERYKDITVRMLMNHTSGLKGSIYGGSFRFNNKSTEYHDSFLELLSKERLKYTPGEYNCYCNDGFTLLEILVERVSKMSFTEYVEENIVIPLGLKNTGTVWNMPSPENQVPIYINGDVRMPAECSMLPGAGGIMSDAEELCVFGSAFFEGEEILLSENAKNLMSDNQATGLTSNCFGLGWDEVSISDYEAVGVKVLHKGGDTFYQHASLTVAPEEEISIAVVSSGGSSSVNEDISLKLMDIALEEKGIKVEHPEPELPETLECVPEEQFKYEGQYTIGQGLINVSFPNGKYMLIRSLNDSNPFEEQYVYTENKSFVKVLGDVESGNSIPVSPVEELVFETVNGRDFIKEPHSEYQGERVRENKVDLSSQEAWEARDGVTYYCISADYDDVFILQSTSVTLDTYDEVRGYVNGAVIIDENHAEDRTNIPGFASRDTSDIEITEKDGCEFLTFTDLNTTYISEKNISDYSDDLTEVETESNNAIWYRLNGTENKTVRFDVPSNAAVYVFDKFGNVKYSSFMSDYNSGVPLPEYGMILFMGDAGAVIGIHG